MATAQVFNCFLLDVFDEIHDLKSGTADVLKVALTNSAPLATNTVIGDITQIANGNGYTTGGATIGTLTGTQTSGVFKLINGTQPSWTASGGSMGTFRYAVLYNSTSNGLICWYDRGSALTLLVGETFTIQFDQVGGIFTAQAV